MSPSAKASNAGLSEALVKELNQATQPIVTLHALSNSNPPNYVTHSKVTIDGRVNYVKVVTDPIHTLEAIATDTQQVIEIHSQMGDVLFVSATIDKDDSKYLLVEHPIEIEGHPVYSLKMYYDNTRLLWLILAAQIGLVLLFVVGGSLGALFALHALQINLFDPMIRLENALRRLLNGDLTVEIPPSKRKGPVGDMQNSTVTFIEIFKTNHEIAQSALRSQFALQTVSSPVLVLDQEGVILACNEPCEMIFSRHGDDYRHVLSTVQFDDPVGSTFAINQLGLGVDHLNNVNERLSSDLQTGDRFLRVSVSPVSDENGQRIGFIVEIRIELSVCCVGSKRVRLRTKTPE